MQRLKVHRCAQHFLQIRPRALTGTRIEKCRAHLCTVHSLKYAPQKKRYNLYPLAIGCLFRYHIVTTPLPPGTSSSLLNIYGIYILVDTFVHFPSHSSFVIFMGKVENNRTNLGNPLEVTVKKCIFFWKYLVIMRAIALTFIATIVPSRTPTSHCKNARPPRSYGR